MEEERCCFLKWGGGTFNQNIVLKRNKKNDLIVSVRKNKRITEVKKILKETTYEEITI